MKNKIGVTDPHVTEKKGKKRDVKHVTEKGYTSKNTSTKVSK